MKGSNSYLIWTKDLPLYLERIELRASRVVQETNHQLKFVGPIAILAGNNAYIDKSYLSSYSHENWSNGDDLESRTLQLYNLPQDCNSPQMPAATLQLELLAARSVILHSTWLRHFQQATCTSINLQPFQNLLELQILKWCEIKQFNQSIVNMLCIIALLAWPCFFRRLMFHQVSISIDNVPLDIRARREVILLRF